MALTPPLVLSPPARRAYACAVNFPQCMSDGSLRRPCHSLCQDYCDACYVSSCPCSDLSDTNCFLIEAEGEMTARTSRLLRTCALMACMGVLPQLCLCQVRGGAKRRLQQRRLGLSQPQLR